MRYLDADGKERFCTEYTVLESVIIEDFFNSDNKWYDMPAGWYVVEGDVTITPRLDTHGAVNLILTDDCHLTVPWGINVKGGDTFTIYAQSTAEASMGKLTACLPEWSDHEKSVWPVAGLSGIGAGVRVWAANDNFYENEGTIIINGGNIRAKDSTAPPPSADRIKIATFPPTEIRPAISGKAAASPSTAASSVPSLGRAAALIYCRQLWDRHMRR